MPDERIHPMQYPPYLYHATYNEYIPSIRRNGLKPRGAPANWTDSSPEYVYLANDSSIAESFAECAEILPENIDDTIIILKISTANLNPNNIQPDSNIQENDGTTWEHHGPIPPTCISFPPPEPDTSTP